jgi:hypothetical protein
MTFHLAEVNIARMKASQDDPLLADFVAQLDDVNRLAEDSEGFVWRYMSDARNPQDREFDDQLMLFNMSVWQSAEHLFAFTYRSHHAEVYKDRKKWFHLMEAPSYALWWVPAGHIPSVDEALAKLKSLETDGPTPSAFNFKVRFNAQGTREAGGSPLRSAA